MNRYAPSRLRSQPPRRAQNRPTARAASSCGHDCPWFSPPGSACRSPCRSGCGVSDVGGDCADGGQTCSYRRCRNRWCGSSPCACHRFPERNSGFAPFLKGEAAPVVLSHTLCRHDSSISRFPFAGVKSPQILIISAPIFSTILNRCDRAFVIYRKISQLKPLLPHKMDESRKIADKMADLERSKRCRIGDGGRLYWG